MEFYSQFGEDKWLVENHLVNVNKKGFFLDIGAGHYQRGSNSYYLEQQGWEGVCVDADPRTFNLLLMNRKKCIFGVASDHFGLEKFYLSTISSDISRTREATNSEEIVLPYFPIASLIDTLGLTEIDLLSIDVEGDETKCLENFFAHTPQVLPKIIIVEFMSLQENNEERTRALFDKLPYKAVHKTEANLIYQYV